MGLFIMPEILRNLTVAGFLCAYWVFISPLRKFTRKSKYLANRFSQMNNLQNSVINKILICENKYREIKLMSFNFLVFILVFDVLF